MKWIALAAGSLLGGFSRYLLAGVVYQATGTDFPYGTLVINLTGCFLIGLFNSLAEVKFLLPPNARILLMTGFCGAYTTFSTFILETSNLVKDGEAGRALANVLLSVGIGFAMLLLGEFVGKAV